MTIDFDIRFEFETTAPPSQNEMYTGWRGLYRSEGGNDHAWHMPAVIPAQWNGVKYGKNVTFTEDLQWLSWNFTRETNKLMTGKNWAATFNGGRVLTNQNGWDNFLNEPDDQRRDYVQNRYAGYPDPLLMDALFMAGNFLPYLQDKGDGHLWAIPGLSGIDITKPLPTIDEILQKNWYMRMTINHGSGGGSPYDFSNGQGGGVFVPFFLKEPVPYTKSHFERWDSDQLPDPLKIYR